METDKIWKNRAFKYAYSRLRPKLCTRIDNDYRPETLITVFSDHFPLATQNAEHEADEAVQSFKNKLQDVKFLTPLGFYDIKGDRKDHLMIKKTRAPNVTYLKLATDIPMDSFASVFEGKSCHLEYFLHLPQDSSVVAKKISAPLDSEGDTGDEVDVEGTIESSTSSMFTSNSATDEGTDDNPDRSSSLFTAATGTPKKEKSKSEKSKKKKEEKRVAESPVKSSTHTIFHEEIDCDTTGVGVLPTVMESDYPETSNDSFDISTIQKQAPKLAMMLQQGRHSRKAGSLQTYNGPLAILDDQQTYEFEITRRFEPFDLKPDSTGARTIVEYSDTEKRIK